MKKSWCSTLFIGLLFLLSFQGFAEEADEEQRNVIVDQEKDPMGKVVEEFPKVKDAIDKCNKQRDAGAFKNEVNRAKAYEDCVWNGIPQTEQEKVLAFLATDKNGVEDEENFDYNLGNFKKTDSEAIKKLEDYLEDRIQKILFGENNNKRKALMDHTDTYRLYESQLSKNLIQEIGGYCIFSDPETGLVPYEAATYSDERKLAIYYRKQNIKNLTQVEAINDQALSDQNGNEASKSYPGFYKCMTNIATVCHGRSPGSATPAPTPTPAPGQNSPKIIGQGSKPEATDAITAEIDNGDQEEYKQKINIMHPCELNRYMTGVKVALKHTQGISKEFQPNMGRGSTFGVTEEVSAVNASNKIVNINSEEALEKSGYKDAAEDEANKLKDCALQTQVQGPCSQYVSDAEDNQTIEDEAFIRGLAYEKKLEKKFENEDDKDEFKKYFMYKGMDEATFNKLVQQLESSPEVQGGSKTVEEALKDYITERYSNERKAIHKQLQARLNETEIKENEDPQKVEEKIQGIKSRLDSTPDQFAATIHYTNIVSSFIAVTDQDGNGSTNTVALARELDGNFFDGDDSGRGVASQADYGALQGQVEEDENSSAEGATGLSVQEIDMLQHGVQAEDDGNQP